MVDEVPGRAAEATGTSLSGKNGEGGFHNLLGVDTDGLTLILIVTTLIFFN